MTLRITMFVVGLGVLLGVFELLRRRSLREKYAAIWLITGVATLLGAAFPGAIAWVSHALGFQVASNFVLFTAGLVLLFTVMQMSLELGKVESQVQKLSEEIALLRVEIGETDTKN